MFKNIFFLGLASGVLATIACVVYTSVYFSEIVDFSEAAGTVAVLTKCLMFTMASCFVYFGMRKIIKNPNIANFAFNLLITLVSVGLVFYILKIDDPQFKNEDAQLMNVFFKGFVMPMLFFPALAWMTLKPIFIKA